MSSTRTAEVLLILERIVGSRAVNADEAAMERYGADWRGAYRGRPAAVVRPGTTEEVAAVVRACAAAGTPIVPQGGNTGMCGGATPDASGRTVVLAMERMNRILEIDPVNNTATVEAGCILAHVQQAAAAAGRLFPLSLGAEGSCQIGGNLSTNAGGINVLRYGNARDLALGLEAVLPDGTIWSGLRGLRKDNTGYDLKHLFIGAEGTLGVITKAVLKLFPLPTGIVTALVAVPTPEAAVALLSTLRAHCGDRISAFELISASCVAMVNRQLGIALPLAAKASWYVLLEVSDAKDDETLRSTAEHALAEALEARLASDAVVAQSLAHAKALWKLREAIPQAALAEKRVFRSDIALPISRLAGFIETATAAIASGLPGARAICFGHLGDGNLHFNAILPGACDVAAEERLARTVNGMVLDHGGSISAEHGIGQSKTSELARARSAGELTLMRTIKAALDPRNLMNPGKVVDQRTERLP
jgi:FAD/FMN-containing dehydrogenase